MQIMPKCPTNILTIISVCATCGHNISVETSLLRDGQESRTMVSHGYCSKACANPVMFSVRSDKTNTPYPEMMGIGHVVNDRLYYQAHFCEEYLALQPDRSRIDLMKWNGSGYSVSSTWYDVGHTTVLELSKETNCIVVFLPRREEN